MIIKVRRHGFCKEIMLLKCRETNKICFDEFYSLSFQEAREKEKILLEKKKRAEELRKLKRLQKKKDAAYERRRVEEEKKLKHQLDLQKLELNLTKKHSMDTRIEISRHRTSAKQYVDNLNDKASNNALTIMNNVAVKSQNKIESTYKNIGTIQKKSSNEIKKMYEAAKKEIALKHEKAEEVISKRWEHEKRNMGEIRREMYRANNEALKMFEEDKRQGLNDVRRHIDQLKKEAYLEVKLLREQTLKEIERMREDGK